jgi:hypothetical protein
VVTARGTGTGQTLGYGGPEWSLQTLRVLPSPHTSPAGARTQWV